MNYEQELLRERLGSRLHFYPEIGSTNDEAFKLAEEGVSSGAIILAERQLAGRGRRGSDWFCGEESGLAFSLMLRPSFKRALWPRLSLVAGLAVARSIEAAGQFPEVKWPNDVLIAGRKVAGILVEAKEDCVVVGIGLNVGKEELPESLQEIATTLASEGGSEKSREDYIESIVKELEWMQNRVAKGFPEIIAEVRSRCALSEKRISFVVGQEEKIGLCKGIDEGGELLVLENGVVKRYATAEQIRVEAECF